MTAHTGAQGVPAQWAALEQRQVPAWFHDAKLGIFVHWGLYSVPAWAPRVDHINAIIAKRGAHGLYRANPYSEWYLNSYRVPGSPSAKHHRDTYGDLNYYEFAKEFNTEAAQADLAGFARNMRAAGAEYVVLTSKHHDGFTLWPSEVAHPQGRALHAQRDLVGELGEAVRTEGMRMGLYYSGGYDWSVHDVVLRRLADALLAMPPQPAYERYATAHVRELIERYRPSVLWNDIGWPGGGDLSALFTAYYEAVPDGVVNDRWSESPTRRGPLNTLATRVGGRLIELLWPLVPRSLKKVGFPLPRHSDFATPEYQTFDEVRDDKWEQTRGIGHSFALNRNEHAEDMIEIEDLIHGFVDVVSKNGNVLLGVGPAADGTIPEPQQRVLDGLGAWLRVNGEAIKSTRPWHVAEGRTDRGTALRFTQSRGAVNAIMLDRAPVAGQHVLEQFTTSTLPRKVEVLGCGEVPYRLVDGRLAVDLPERLPDSPAHTVRVTGSCP
jgi:alpha-L-fucosidase